MSMLAEPRRKKAWILNPRRSQWAEDESKYGQKMLEQMGWSKGKGLGREMTGITEHIRPSVQNDSRGLGYEGRSDDWVAHLDDFNDLLANLQQDKKEAEKEDGKATVNSLEERSKKSKARVHYHKFTRGKDLSRYSSQDLAGILGGRQEGGAASQPVTPVTSRPSSPPPQARSAPASEDEAGPAAPPAVQRDDSSGYVTINTGLSVQDYFAAKMRKMKMLKINHGQKRGDTEVGDVDAAVGNADLTCSGDPLSVPSYGEGDVSDEPKRKKRKKQKALSGVSEGDPEEVHRDPEMGIGEEFSAVKSDEVADFNDDISVHVREIPVKKKKNKKRKKSDNGREIGPAGAAEGSLPLSEENKCPAKESAPAASDNNAYDVADVGETSEKKKKKRKKNKSKRCEDSD